MPKPKPLPPVERLRELYDVDEEKGLLVSRRTGRAVGFLNKDGYLLVKLSGAKRRVHRVIWALAHGQDPGSAEIDHINGDRSDNRPCNLRLATSASNQWNTGARVTNSHGFKGVTCLKGRWWARIRHDGRRIGLGFYGTPEEAHAAYVAAANDMHGEFARAA